MSAGEAGAGPLSAARRALLERRLRGAGARPRVAADFPKAAPGPVPLTSAQWRLWFLEQLRPGNPAYHIAKPLGLLGPLDAGLLANAIRAVVRRQDALRSAIQRDGDAVRQATVAPWEPVLPLVSLAHLELERAREEAYRVIAAEARRPFDLASGQLARFVLLRVRRNEHVLSVVAHHIACDGWSVGVLFRELAQAYNALKAGTRPEFAALAMSYRDYAAQEGGRLDAGRLDALLRVWRARLAGEPPRVDLGTRTPGPRRDVHPRSGFLSRPLPAGVAGGLRRLQRQRGFTPFVCGLTALVALIVRRTGLQDVWLGSVVSGRQGVEVEPLVGLFVNTLVLRVDAAGASTLDELLRRAREVVVEALDHQDLPFARLVEELAPRRDRSGTPFFDVAFAYHAQPPSPVAFDGLRPGAVEVPPAAPTFELMLSLVSREDTLTVTAEFDADVYAEDTVAGVLDQYEAVLRHLCDSPGSHIAALALCAPEAVPALAALGAGPAGVALSSARVVDRLRDRAGEAPDAIVVEDEAVQITARTLLDLVARTAGHLWHALGVRPGQVVAVDCDQSIAMVVSLLAVDAVGACALPLDADGAPQRTASCIAAARPVLLLTRAPERAPPSLRGTAVDPMAVPAHTHALALDEPRVRPEHDAYIVFTSGSTGTPKGVAVQRHALMSALGAFEALLQPGPGDSLLATTRPTFDIAFLELFLPLVTGARLSLCAGGQRRDPQALAARARLVAPSLLQMTPSGWRLLHQCQWRPARHQGLLCGGEPLEASLQHFLARGSRALWNLYGPTEATIWATAWRAPAEPPVRIGQPLPGRTVRLLDRNLGPVPPGVIGDLYLAGEGIARGYIDAPAQTASRFVPDPWGSEPGARMYRTGDLARWHPDGALEFLGRADRQLKILGHRVEPAEVEEALRAVAGIRDAVVRPTDAGGTLQLAAYLVLAADASPDLEALTAGLRARLPAAMIPARFFTLDAVPLTASGKVDGAAVARLAGGELTSARRPQPPASAAEVALAEVWQEVLGRDGIGVHDLFFSLGGDSLRAVEVVARARERGLQVRLEDLFRYQTVREVAARSVMQAGNVPAPVLPDAPAGSAPPPGAEDAWPLTDHQLAMLAQTPRADGVTPYCFSLGVHLRAALVPSRWRAAWAGLGRRHGALRSSLHLRGHREPLQVLHGKPDALAGPCLVDLGALPPERRRAVLERTLGEVTRAVAAGSTAPVRLLLHRCDENSFWATVVGHHAVLDGTSRVRLIDELLSAALAGAAVPEQPAQDARVFREVLRRERAATRDAATRQFWTEQLARVPRRARAAGGDVGAGRRVTLDLAGHALAALRDVARASALPLRTALLAIHARALAGLSGQETILSGLVSDGRPPLRGAADVLGSFARVLPVVLGTAHARPRELLRSTHDAEADALAFREMPLSAILSLGGEPGAPRAIRQLDAVFNYTDHRQGPDWRALAGGGLLAVRSVEPTPLGLVCNAGLTDDGGGLRVVLEVPPTLDPAAVEQAYTAAAAWLTATTPSPGTATAREPDPLLGPVVAGFHARPAKAALIDGADVRSAAELSRRAGAWAAALASRGIGVEDRVALCAERSGDAVAALLGILGAGATCVPIEPGHPAAHLRAMLRDARVRCTIAGAGSVADDVFDGERLALEWAATAASGDMLEAPQVPPEAGALVLFTSGTTGRPRPVVLTRTALARYAADAARLFDMGPDARVLQFSSLGFDTALEEIFCCFAAGGALVLRPPGPPPPPAGLMELIARHGVTHVDLPTAYWHLLVGELPRAPLPAEVRVVIIGGEEAQPGAVEAWRASAPAARLVNTYGPTEATVVATVANLDGDGAPVGEAVSIGEPVAGTLAHVLDDTLRPSAPDARGELFLGGPRLARGYLGRPGLTAERFLPDPLSPLPGGRMFRTGDSVRRGPDGALVFLGRRDRQVKLLGHRIEPEGIEALLQQHPRVRAAAVVLAGAREGHPRLVAHVVPREASPGLEQDVLSWLRERLPRPHVPAEVVVRESLPLTLRGKVDRGALCSHTEPGAAPAVPPREPLADIVLGIWEDVLERRGIALSDDLFDLGGHSLLAIRLLVRVEDALGVEVTLRDFLDDATPAGMLALLAAGPANAAPRERIARTTSGPWGELTPGQASMWAQNQAAPGLAALTMPLAMRLTGPLDADALAAALVDTVVRHDLLCSVFPMVDGRPRQRVLPATAFALDRAGVAQEPEPLRAGLALVAEEHRLPFDLGSELPFRALLVALGPGDHLLALSVHHLAADGMSLPYLLQTMAAAYRARARGLEPRWPEPALRWADYAAWLAAQRQRGAHDPQLAYWKQRLAGPMPALNLAGTAVPPAPSMRYGEAVLDPGPALGDAVRAGARDAAATVPIVLLGALCAAVHAASDEDDVRIGTQVAQRADPELDGLVGLLVDTVVLRCDLGGDPTLQELVRRMRERMLEAYAQRHVPFEDVLQALDLTPEARRDLYNVLFVYQPGAGDPGLDLGDVTVARPVDAPREPVPEPGILVSTYALIVYAFETPHGIRFAVRHDCEQLPLERCRLVLDRFHAALRALAAAPQTRLSDLGPLRAQ